MADDRYFDEQAQRWEEEGLFARDLNGQLIRDVAPEASDYGKMVEVLIDGQTVVVPRAVPTSNTLSVATICASPDCELAAMG